jgi:hypothetical protein
VSTEGISADPTKIESVKAWPSPKTTTDVQSFMGTCSYYRRFINLHIPLANKGIDAINISNILNRKEVVKEIPPYFKK